MLRKYHDVVSDCTQVHFIGKWKLEKGDRDPDCVDTPSFFMVASFTTSLDLHSLMKYMDCDCTGLFWFSCCRIVSVVKSVLLE